MVQTTRLPAGTRVRANSPAPRETLRQLRHLIALSEHCNYHAAAEVLGLTQAALTQSIQKLEEHYGVPLFERGAGGVRITECGSIAAEAARETLDKLSRVRRDIRIAHRLERPKIVVGCDSLLLEGILAPALATPRFCRGGFTYSLEPGGWEVMQPRMLAGEVDMYLGFVDAEGDSKISVEEHTQLRWYALFRNGHPFSGRSELSFTEMCTFPLVVPSLSRPMLVWIRKHCADNGHKDQSRLPTFLQTPDRSVIRHIIGNTDAISLAVEPAIYGGAEKEPFRSAEIKELPTARCAIVTRRRDSSSLGLDALLSAIRKRLRRMPLAQTLPPSEHAASVPLREMTGVI